MQLLSNEIKAINKRQQPLFDMILGPIRWNILEFAFQTQLFDHFITPHNVNDIAHRHQWCPERLTLLLNAYVSLGVMKKEAGIYTVHPDYIHDLYSLSPTYVGDTLSALAKLRSLSPPEMTQWLTQSGTENSQTNMRDQQFWQQSIIRLRAFHRCTRNPVLLPLLKQLPGWQDGMHFLDIGAGSAELAKTILAEYPHSQVTLFDLPPCCDAIDHLLRQEESIHPGIQLSPGDMNKDSFGGPYNMVLIAMCLYFADDLHHCLQRLWDTLAPGGTLLSFHESLSHERTQPAFHILGRLSAELTHGPLSLDYTQIEAALQSCHPASLETQHITTPFGEMALTIARKSI